MLRKLLNNWANRLDPKFIIIYERKDHPKLKGLNLQSISFANLDKKLIRFEKYNSVMMVKHVCKENKEAKLEHFVVERW